MSILELGELVEELSDILEITVDARKANVRHRIQPPELVQDVLPEPGGRHLLVPGVDEPALDLVQEAFEGLRRDGTFHARAPEARQELVAVIGLAPTIVLHDERQGLFHPFVRGVAPSAMLTLSPASRDLACLGKARVDDAVLQRSAIGAAHIRAHASARTEPGQCSAASSSANEADEGFQVSRLWKHVEPDEAVDVVAFRGGKAKVARERSGVARDINHAFRTRQELAVFE